MFWLIVTIVQNSNVSAHVQHGYTNNIDTKMASSMSGMFPGQQPPGQHPVGAPGGPGQPGFPVPVGPGPRGPGNNTLVDELEASFEVLGQYANLLLASCCYM